MADLAAVEAPVLILAGDEDDGCLNTSVWLKRTIPRAGLAVLPKSGHTLNIEEPDLTNTLIANFLHRVTANAWPPQRPKSHPRRHSRLLTTTGICQRRGSLAESLASRGRHPALVIAALRGVFFPAPTYCIPGAHMSTRDQLELFSAPAPSVSVTRDQAPR